VTRSVSRQQAEEILRRAGVAIEDNEVVSAEVLAAFPGAGASDPTSWRPLDLEAVIEGGTVDHGPTMLTRTDGRALLYPGRSHAFQGEPETGKTWFALAACVEAMTAGRPVAYFDFEAGPDEIVARLQALGADAAHVALLLRYVRPEEPLNPAAVADLKTALEGRPAIGVVDGVNEAMTMMGFDPNANRDAALFFAALPRRIMAAGAAAALIDHVTKAREDRGRWAVGAGHKMAAVDVAYSLDAVRPFGRGLTGAARITVRKDRPGFVRGFAAGGRHVGEFVLDARDEDCIGWRVEPATDEGGTLRPTVLMQRLAAALEVAGELSGRGVEERVKGRGEYVRKALACLIDEGHVETKGSGRATVHRLVRPFTEEGE